MDFITEAMSGVEFSDDSGIDFKTLSARVLKSIDDYVVSQNEEPYRSHLGASELGNPCDRYLWLTFRWCKKDERLTGRHYRLFDRGHLEETRVSKWLVGAGFDITTVDENGNQLVFSCANGHIGGSCDGIGYFPPSFGIREPFIWENKTNSTGSQFNSLCSNGVSSVHPKHYAQASVYGCGFNIDIGLYVNTNKNDDTMYVETFPIQKDYGRQLIDKGESLIVLREAPDKISQNPKCTSCAPCKYRSICHGGKPIDRNCRSCINAIPVENASWKCLKFNDIIPKSFWQTGCDNWQPVFRG